MTTWTCGKLKPITYGDEIGDTEILSAKDAAFAFADRLARREFGRSRGYCHHVRLDGVSTDGRYANYQAFIGRAAQGGGTYGHNIWIAVYSEPSEQPNSLGPWQ